jgi:peptide/nickel transport system ATP-binding protein
MNTNELIKVENLSVLFKTEEKTYVKAVNNISFSIQKGETLALVGESGCGKSVTSLSIMSLLQKTSSRVEGEITFNGKNLIDLSEKEMRSIRGKDMSMIFQEPMTSLNPVHKIGKQIGEVLRLHTNLSKEEVKQETIHMLIKVGIPRAEKIINEFPHQLSGGMRQRVMIAMAMACNPSLLIADEPTTALDVTIQAQILELMNGLKKQNQTSILLITHDLGVVAEMAERVMVMYYGQIVEEGDIRSIFNHPKHPYTIGLLESIPNLDDDEQTRLEPIQGNVPNIGEVTKGCPFAKRCKVSIEECLEVNPPLLSTDGGTHKVRCWLFADKEESA